LPSINNKKPVRWLCLGACAVLLLGAAAVFFLLPRLINKEMVREKIVHLLSQKVAGTVTFQDADISLFPLPRVIIRNASLAIPDKVSGTVRTLTVFPELRPLLSGQVRLSKIQIDEPVFNIHLPPKTDEPGPTLQEIAKALSSLTLGSAEIRLRLDRGSITLEKDGHTPASLREIGLSLDLTSSNDDVAVIINRLTSKDPGFYLSAEFRVNPSSNTISLEAKGKDLDISSIRKEALALAEDVPIVHKIFDILRDGTVERIAFQSAGNSPEDLGRTANIRIQGRVNRASVMVSSLDLGFREVSGDCDIKEGILHGSDLKGAIMKSRISDGKLRIGLKGKDALFQADAAVSADLTDVHTILSRIVKNPAFHQELAHIKAISGSAEGRLVLGESLLSVRPKVDIAKIKFSASYDRVPLPIAVDQGSFSYDEKGVSVKNLAGTIGKSAISGLSAQMQTANSYIEILSGKAGLETAEVHRWLASYEKLKEPLHNIASLRGRLNLSSLTFRGPVMDSKAWKFKVAGSAEKLVINTSLLPGSLAVNSGKFETQAGQLIMSDLGIGFLDASPVVSGSLDISLENVRKGDIRLSGTVGPKALQWIKTAFSIPDYIRTDQALTVSGSHLTWQEKGETAFEASMKIGAGLSVALNLSKNRDGLLIKKLDIADAVSKASLSIDIQETIKRLSFKGRLDTSTAASLISTPQVKGGMVQGEIMAEFGDQNALGITAQGRLRGDKIVLPWKKEMLLSIDALDMSADRGSIAINSARLGLAGNSVSLKGTIAAKTGGLVLDLDASSDRIEWDALVKANAESSKEKQPEKKNKPLTVQGLVRLKTDRFDYEGFQIAPFNADIALSGGKTDIRIGKSRLCGIGVIGDINISSDKVNPEMGLDLRFDATDQEFKQTVLCISKGRSDATGLFTLKGNLKGRGKTEDLKKVLEGKVEFAAKKGAIYRYKTLDSVLDFVNKGEELKGQMPDLDKSELSYELLKITASFGKGMLVIDEAMLDSVHIEIVAEGTLNLIDNRLDLNVMVAPLRQVKRALGQIPVIGSVVSGAVISVPVKVTGTSTEPKVAYLSPSATASHLAGMMKNTLNLPVSILSPLFPKEKQE
jgi:hypothetical protein